MVHQLTPSNQTLNTDFMRPPCCCSTVYIKKALTKVAHFSIIYYHTLFQDPILCGTMFHSHLIITCINHVITGVSEIKLDVVGWPPMA